jgi:hypothetical protein
MKSIWFTLILVALFAASGNTHLLAQTPEKLYQKDLTKEKGDVVACQRMETNLPTHKKEIPIAREKWNRSTWKKPHLDRIGAALSRGPSRNNGFLGEVDATTDHLINEETLIITSGTEPFLPGVLQFLKTAGKSLLTNGILTILIVFILLMLIFNLHVSYTNKREWDFIL